MRRQSRPRHAVASTHTLSRRRRSGHARPDSAAEDPRAHDDVLFRLFTEIGIIHQLAGAAFQKVLPLGLTGAQFAILNHCVRMGDNKTPAQLADILQVTRATLTSTLGRLERKGLIRLEADDYDGRCKRVLLTEAGRHAREAAVAAAMPLLERVAAAVPAADAAALLSGLTQVRAWLDQNRSL